MRSLFVGLWLLQAMSVCAVAQHPTAAQEYTLAKFDPPYRLPSNVRVHEDVVYSRSAERELRLDLFAPRSTQGPLPVILFIQGSGYNGNNKVHFWRQAAHFASLGFVSVCIEHRGLGPDNAKWPAQLVDGRSAIRWIREMADRFRIDTERIAVVGASSGGHIAAMLGVGLEVDTLAHGSIKAVVTVNAILDPVYFGRHEVWSREYQMVVDLAPLFGVAYLDDPDAWESASPLTYVSSDAPPFLIMHGTADGSIPPQQAETMGAALRRKGVQAEVVLIDGGDHEMDAAFAYHETLERMERFLTRLLQRNMN